MAVVKLIHHLIRWGREYKQVWFLGFGHSFQSSQFKKKNIWYCCIASIDLKGAYYSVSTAQVERTYVRFIIWLVRPCERFLYKTIDESPVWGSYAFARAGPEKAVRPSYNGVRPRVLKLQANWSPNWSYNKILIDQVRSGRTGKYLALGHGARTSLRSVVRHDLEPNIFPSGAPT